MSKDGLTIEEQNNKGILARVVADSLTGVIGFAGAKGVEKLVNSEIYMIKVITNMEQESCTVYRSLVGDNTLLIDTAKGKVYFVNNSLCDIEYDKGCINVKSKKSANGWRCIYNASSTRGVDTMDFSNQQISTKINKKGTGDYETMVIDDEKYGTVRIKLHSMIISTKIGFDVINAMQENSAMDIHHIDFNQYNNARDNLIYTTWENHQALHGNTTKKQKEAEIGKIILWKDCNLCLDTKR
ncbi:hypothetical protein G9F72_019295 [Clostridium estertheticum]|uniref:hypothetical protein n=1 Tax=Clostridium estertheticum TaxID=238834 RepID=UPI0013E93B0F|nr:hypothetical protein [Clostridium estertheticum]MBZ9688479.1 hypothetical protein [Clostridium estertheticum]